MEILKGANPIIRGQCDVCGMCRNLRVLEMGAARIPCDHVDRGCAGCFMTAYTGPKALMPDELRGSHCTCALALPAASQDMLSQLQEMGFQTAAAEHAATHCSTLEAAVEWLTGPEGQAATASSMAATSSTCSVAASAPAFEPLECAICVDDLAPADAAMRCAGHGGKQHYFHAHCMVAWVRQCQVDDADVTCPECRGPVQIRQRRLQEFLQEKGNRLDSADAQAMQTFASSAQEGGADEFGWSQVKPHIWKVGVGLGIMAGLALAVAAGAQLLSQNKRRRNDRDEH